MTDTDTMRVHKQFKKAVMKRAEELSKTMGKELSLPEATRIMGVAGLNGTIVIYNNSKQNRKKIQTPWDF